MSFSRIEICVLCKQESQIIGKHRNRNEEDWLFVPKTTISHYECAVCCHIKRTSPVIYEWIMGILEGANLIKSC